MARGKRVTVTLPPGLAAMVEEVRKQEGCTTTEFVRAAVSRYASDKRREALFRYGEMKAKEVGLEGITAEEVSELIHARRERERAAAGIMMTDG